MRKSSNEKSAGHTALGRPASRRNTNGATAGVADVLLSNHIGQ
jgi:hypothetical protein